MTTYYYDRIHKCYVKELTIVAVSGSFVTGGAIRKYGGVSGRSSTSITTSWTPTFLVSMSLSVQNGSNLIKLGFHTYQQMLL